MEAQMQEMVAAPGTDTRQWASYGTVDPDSGDERSVRFVKGLGPIVSVTLQPSGIPVECRVGAGVAGGGEGEYYPFCPNDEVLVVIPEGDERAGAVIVARLNNELDAWPDTVAANDATKNNFGFRRMRAPYVLETAHSYGVRNAVTGALLMMEASGVTTIQDGFFDFLRLGPDFVGLQATDDPARDSPVTTPGATLMVLQLDKKGKQIRAELQGKGILTIGNDRCFFGSVGPIQISANGATPSEHVATTEQVLNLLHNLLFGLSLLSAPGALAGLGTPATRDEFLATVLGSASSPATGTLTPTVMGALAGAMQAKVPNASGNRPGVTCPGFLAG